VKSVLTLLVGLALLWRQSLFTAELPSSKDSVRSDCACTHCSCVEGGQKAPTPAAPAATQVLQNQLQIFLASAMQWLASPAASTLAPSSSLRQILPLVDAPLYQRDCAYLI